MSFDRDRPLRVIPTPPLTIGIPTAGRPQAIAACLESIRRHVDVEHRVVVLDSLPSDQARETYAIHPTVTWLESDTPLGPAAARRRIGEAVDTPYLLYLDDDNLVTRGAVRALLDHLERYPDVEIVAGSWHEDRSAKDGSTRQRRTLGQFFRFGRDRAGPVVIREGLTLDDHERLNLAAYRVDAVQATMLMQSRILSDVAFDPRYDFFFDLFDFFMQCRQRGLRTEVIPDVVFGHRPLPYEQATVRQSSDKDLDERRFVDKWGVRPVRSQPPSLRSRLLCRGSRQR